MLVLRGEAGVGKSALLSDGADQAADFRVISVAGVESEMELPFAGLQQLCAPLLDRVIALPEPQQSALRVAFGLSFGHVPDGLRVALASLSLIAEAATERPLLCVIDDAQWLDAASAQVLAMVARRLLAEPVAMLFAARLRADADAFADLPELEVEGLGPADAERLLERYMSASLDVRVRDRLVIETKGNPLALLELAWAPSVPIQFGSGVPWPQDLSGRIEREYVQRIGRLDDEARRLLLLAAAEPTGDPVLLWRAARRLGIALQAIPSEAQGLLTIRERVTFHHPLVRSAIYRAAAADDRRAVHLALAHATDPREDGDRRAWHRAAAARGPDEEAATELEQSATRARARGGFAAAAAFLQRSVALTRDPEQRGVRAINAATASLRAGALADARAALEAARATPLDEVQSARVELLRGQIAFAAGSAVDASALLLEAARTLEKLDLALARETYLGACGAAIFAGPAAAQDLVSVGRAVRRLPEAAGEPRATDVLLDGLALLITDGRTAAAPTLLRAAAAFAGDAVPIEESLRWGWMATAGSNALWDDDGVRGVCERHIGLARDAGALEHLPIYLIALATATARGGDFPAASSLIAEADAVAEATGTRLAPFAAELILAALRGSAPEVFSLKQAAIERAASSGQGMPTTVAAWSEAILLNGLGRYQGAVEAARRATSAAGDLYSAMWAMPELVEASTRVNDAAAARDALDRLVETTRAAGTDYGLGIEARSRALLSGGERAQRLYLEALERLRRTKVAPEVARTHLLYGESLRRDGRRREASEQLRTAHEMFLGMGMEAFAERASRELGATGLKARKRAVDSRDDLTPREVQIASLARDGLTNSEIAARLFLSPHTVEWHLKNVFVKLGTKSRRELRELPEGALGPSPA